MMAKKTKLDQLISKIVRTEAGFCGRRCPIEFIDGFERPMVAGDAGRHKGDFYWPSTLRIIVGKGWVCEQLAEEWQCQLKLKQKGKRQSTTSREST